MTRYSVLVAKLSYTDHIPGKSTQTLLRSLRLKDDIVHDMQYSLHILHIYIIS
jgi:hypothetical protein